VVVGGSATILPTSATSVAIGLVVIFPVVVFTRPTLNVWALMTKPSLLALVKRDCVCETHNSGTVF